MLNAAAAAAAASCGDTTMTGAAELLDSLVEQQRRADSGGMGVTTTAALSVGKSTNPIYTIADDYNDDDDDDVLLEPEPVADIISRLGESLSTSPKCLSFNEAGEIEGLTGDLFGSGGDVGDDDDLLPNPFAPQPTASSGTSQQQKQQSSSVELVSLTSSSSSSATSGGNDGATTTTTTTTSSAASSSTTTLEDELSITIKDLTEASEHASSYFASAANRVVEATTSVAKEVADGDRTAGGNSESSSSVSTSAKELPAEAPIVISPDSCQEELPKDLSCRKRSLSPSPRPVSHSSDAIQSPQPSGLPAVPPSPDLFLQPKSISASSSSSSSTASSVIEALMSQATAAVVGASKSGRPSSGGGGVGGGSSTTTSTATSTSSSAVATTTTTKTGNTLQQKEPLDLGKCRKSASPTVSCSEEAKRLSSSGSTASSLCSSGGNLNAHDDTSEPKAKRIKTDPEQQQQRPNSGTGKTLSSDARSMTATVASATTSSTSGPSVASLINAMAAGGSGSSVTPSTQTAAAAAAAAAAAYSNLNDSARLVEMLTSGNDPDPLTQLRLLVGNPAWKVPDPLLVPKDRLSAVLASPAREIPLLLTTRPELRLPEAFAFPSILQDPDILVISLQQLETILQTQEELVKFKSKTTLDATSAVATPPTTPVAMAAAAAAAAAVSKKSHAPAATPTPPSPLETLKQTLSAQAAKQNPMMSSLLASGLAGDIDAATTAAFNQMLWLPYLGQMGQFAPDLLKAMMNLPNTASAATVAAAAAAVGGATAGAGGTSLADMLPFMGPRFQDFCGLPPASATSPLDYKRQL
uniref:Uncharacterized protein n=1 Tax=Anopheles maculatus TaxID=74869 RepID=A0A182SWP7_9DIPT